MTILVNHQILAAMEVGHIVIEPFIPELLQTCSYDVRIAGEFWKQRIPQRHLFTGETEWTRTDQSSEAVWEKGDTVRQFDDDDELADFIVLYPHDRILARTIERIGGVSGPMRAIQTEMRAKSTFGRWGITACLCAGWGDPGYINHWTLEVQNNNPHHTALIRVGSAIAQIAFHEVAVPTPGTGYDVTGHYKQQTEWDPKQMLPKPLKVVL